MDIVLRAVAVFAFLLVLTRVIGRRELSSLQPIDLILLIILGDAVPQRLTQGDYSLTGSFLAVGTIAVLQVFVSWVGYRFPRTRPVLDGEPIVVVQDGRADRAEPETRTAEPRGDRGGSPLSEHRAPRRRALRHPRDEPPHQLHREGLALSSPRS